MSEYLCLFGPISEEEKGGAWNSFCSSHLLEHHSLLQPAMAEQTLAHDHPETVFEARRCDDDYQSVSLNGLVTRLTNEADATIMIMVNVACDRLDP